MKIGKAGKEPYATVVTDGKHEVICDSPLERGGKDAGFAPPELIEVALAACINITVRKFADSRNIKLTDAIVKVTMNKDDPNKVFIKEEVEFVGELTDRERKTLMQVAKQCTVAKTLVKEFVFDLAETRPETAKA